MIVFGSRIYGKKNKVTFYDYCNHCHNFTELENHLGRKWGHVYFIPIIPETKPLQVLNSCPKCNVFEQILETDLPEALIEFENNSIQIIEDISQEKLSYEELIGAISELKYCLKTIIATKNYAIIDKKIIPHAENLNYPDILNFVKGYSCELFMVEEEATSFYKNAIASDSKYQFIFYEALANYYKKCCRFKDAVDLYEQILTFNINKEYNIFLKLELVNILDRVGDYQSILKYVDECFATEPELAKDKEFYKSYKIACKKEGIKPRKAKEIYK